MPRTLAAATVDRLLHHAHAIVTDGADSYRLTQATEGKGVLIGDPRQIGAVGPGGLYGHFTHENEPIVLTEIRRQRECLDRHVVELAHEGRAGRAGRGPRRSRAACPDRELGKKVSIMRDDTAALYHLFVANVNHLNIIQYVGYWVGALGSVAMYPQSVGREAAVCFKRGAKSSDHE